MFMRHYHTEPRAVQTQKPVTKLDFLKTRIVMKLLVLGIFVVCLSLFYIWSHTRIVQLGYEINELTSAQIDLLNDHKNYQIELVLMKAPQRLQTVATEKLGMAPPQAQNLIAIDGVVTAPVETE